MYERRVLYACIGMRFGDGYGWEVTLYLQDWCRLFGIGERYINVGDTFMISKIRITCQTLFQEKAANFTKLLLIFHSENLVAW